MSQKYDGPFSDERFKAAGDFFFKWLAIVWVLAFAAIIVNNCLDGDCLVAKSMRTK